MPRGSKLTTTSYAVLGLLAIRPWTPYEMTQQMQRSLSRFWPRTVSKLYEEPKKLAEHHPADRSHERIGQRTRTRYAITPDGRRQLGSWLAQPTSDPVLELEFLVRVFLAEHGTRDDLLATLTAVTTWAEQRALQDAEIADGYLTGTGPVPERTAQLALVGKYLSDFSAMTEQWAHWAAEQVEQWPDDPGARTPDWAALRDVTERRRRSQG